MKSTHLMLIAALCCSQAYSFNLPKRTTKSYDCDICASLSHESLHDKWDISGARLSPKISNLQKGYGYHEQVSMKQLRAGVALSTLAPGAVIRITPLQAHSIPALTIQTPNHQLLTLKDASKLYSQEEALGEFQSPHQTMFQIKPALGSGQFILTTKDTNQKDTDAFVIHVLDKFSSTYLEVKTNSLHYQHGDKVKTIITLKDEALEYPIDKIDATIRSPQGDIILLELTKTKHNQYQASTTLLSEANSHGENWYVEVSIDTIISNERVKRYTHAAFSYSMPSASLIHIKKLSSQPLTFVATVDVATASRYALQSVLFRKNVHGDAIPVETSQKAQWLEPGKQLIEFTFDNSDHLTEDTLYLGYLRLIDYGQLKMVYQYDLSIKLNQLE